MRNHTLLLAAALFVASSAAAEPTSYQCYEDQYLTWGAQVPTLQVKAVEKLQQLVNAPLSEIAHQGKVTLLQIESSALGERREMIEQDNRTDLCHRAKRAERAERLQGRGIERPVIIRRTRCSCNYVVTAEATKSYVYPSDPDYTNNSLWGFNLIETPALLGTFAPSTANVVTAVIDSGFDAGHEEFAGSTNATSRVWVNTLEVAGNGVDDDHNGYVDDVSGYDFFQHDNNPMDVHGHGTHVAGTISANWNNKGIAGIAPLGKIMPIRFLGDDGSGSLYDAISAVQYVTAMKRRGVNILVANNSWGGGGFFTPLRDAIEDAKSAGLLFVAAAGNSGQNADTSPMYPAAYNCDNIISVAAANMSSTVSSSTLASFSNYGATNVDIVAPGASIRSSLPGNSYATWNGTSMATPHVSAIATLIYDKSLALTGQAPASWSEVKTAILSHSTPLPQYGSVVSSGSFLNGYTAMEWFLSTRATPPAPTPTPTPPPSTTPTPTPTVTPTPPATPTPSPTATPRPPDSWVTISGAVRDITTNPTGVPLAGVQVALSAAGKTSYLFTDTAGTFTSPQILAGGLVTITFSRPGYTIGSWTGTPSTNLSLQFPAYTKQFTLTASVVDTLGQPLSGVVMSDSTLGTQTSDSLGRATFTNAPIGYRYSLTPKKSGYTFSAGAFSGTLYGNTTRLVVGTKR